MALELLVMVPTVSPASVIALVAAACVWFTTEGTTTGGGPVEITSATALPAATEVPASGVCLITDPAGTVALELLVMVPAVRPASVSWLIESACVWFTTEGTTTGGGP